MVPATAPAEAEPATQVDDGEGLTLLDFVALVGRANLALAAERFNLPATEAQIALARVFPDPAVTGGVLSYDASHQHAPTVVGAGVSGTLELGGKRSARIEAATQARTQASAELDDFFRGLRATAASAFVDALLSRLVLERKRITLDRLDRLVIVNQERFRAGDIGEIAVAQSRVEAHRFRGEVIASESDVRAADLALRLLAGATEKREIVPRGDLLLPPRPFDAEAMVAEARARRPDVVARRVAVTGAESRVRLAHANRWVDLGLSLGWQHTPANHYGGSDNPAFEALSANLTLPLPFSRVYRGELDGALAEKGRAEVALAATELTAEIEVRQALVRYSGAVEQLKVFTGDVLTDAERVFKATSYNYQRGGASLLEVLEAQRTVNEVFLSYYAALAAHARALIGVEQAAGLWDLGM
jgi:cobalt-zinc-cadmium efflux system outer membrane protein